MCISTVLTGPGGELSGCDEAERAHFQETLREGGHVLTAHRAAVIDVICRLAGHICAEHLLGAVRSLHPSLRMNKTTIYRALDLFLDLGLITEIKCGEGRAQYELVSRGRHSHLLCHDCGKLLYLEEDVAAALRADLERQLGFVPDIASHPLAGLCADCRKRLPQR